MPWTNKQRKENYHRQHPNALYGRSASKLGKNNPMWKGNNVGLISLHEWIRQHKPKPILCEECRERPPYDVANISGHYLRDINDFRWLCRSCHMRSDGRMMNLKHQGND